ncbi:MAG: GNAT family N-acetyltransferase [Carbonactinosporaceae bacterium]
MADAHVRPARAGDADAIGDLQVHAWTAAYRGMLPDDVLDTLSAGEVAARWRSAVTGPPSRRHRVLVALRGRDLVGFVAFGPASDDDCDPGETAEVLALLVDPAATGQGHGSRLLTATVEHLRGDGFHTATTWLLATDDGARRFLRDAGWAPDGAHRDLDVHGDGSALVPQVRLHTDLASGA